MKIEDLRQRISQCMSERRFKHTLGVESSAAMIAEVILPERVNEIRIAALLHDLTKELPTAVQLDIMERVSPPPTESDIMTHPLYHSITAPYVIARDFPELATPDVLSAVKNHTVGAADMSLFDEIIFVADYIEEGRTYCDCVNTRDDFLRAMQEAKSPDDLVMSLHETTVRILNNTINYIVNNNMFLNERTVTTRNAFLGRIPVPLKKEY